MQFTLYIFIDWYLPRSCDTHKDHPTIIPTSRELLITIYKYSDNDKHIPVISKFGELSIATLSNSNVASLDVTRVQLIFMT